MGITTADSNYYSYHSIESMLHYCNIYNFSQYSLINQGADDVNASDNWWGTTNETAIGQGIYDFYDNTTLGRVQWKPYLESPVEYDIAVMAVTVTKSVVGRGFPLAINSTVANMGTTTEIFNVTSFAKDTIIDNEEVTLESGNSTTITFTWNTTSFTYGSYTISAYDSPVQGETDTANNNFTGGVVTVTIPGDLNGDFKVSLADLLILANAYKSTPSNVNWNSNADLDGNNAVGLTDLVILAMHYGQHYP